MKLKNTIYCALLLISGAFSSINTYSQVNIKPAIADFNAGRYDAAIESLEQTIEKYDRDARTNYYLGACYVEKHVNISEAIRRLKFAQIKGVVLDSHFYLGRAFQLNFEYEQALASFSKFLKTAKDETLIARANQYAKESENSIPLASKIFNVRVIDKFRVLPGDLLSVYSLSKESGAVLRNSDFFESDIDPEGILYKTERGDAVYFSVKNGDDKDKLYKMERLLDGWGDMTALAGTESAGNDMMPFMMTDGTTLYFASDREGGMGGMDIYRTTYDSESRTFTTPVNLGVPFNSAFDDYLFVGDEFQQKAWFASNRETSSDSLCVYEIVWDDSVIRNFAQSTEDIRQASELPIDPTLASKRDDKTTETGTTKQDFSVTKEMNKFVFEVNDSLTYTQWEHFRSDAAREKYEQALEKQSLRDSLANQMAFKRKEFMQLTTDAERNDKIAEILVIERNLYSTEDELKESYSTVRKMENAFISEQIAAGEYVPLNQVKTNKHKVVFDWEKLLVPSDFEIYNRVPFDKEYAKNGELYKTVFSYDEQNDLQTTDSLYAWVTIMRLEATKMNEHAMHNDEIETTDEDGKTRQLTQDEMAERAEMLEYAASALLNKVYDTRFDIFDDRYESILENEPDIDFSETDALRASAVRDFEQVEDVTIEQGKTELNNAAVIKRRGMDSYTKAMSRYAEHLKGDFTLPQLGQGTQTEQIVTEESTKPQIVAVVEPEPEIATVDPATTVVKQPTTTTSTSNSATDTPSNGKPVYRIQLGVFRNTPDATKLSAFNDITTQEIPDRGLTRYFCGAYSTYTEAQSALSNVKQNGFDSAFIVAFANGEQVKLTEAQKLE